MRWPERAGPFGPLLCARLSGISYEIKYFDGEALFECVSAAKTLNRQLLPAGPFGLGEVAEFHMKIKGF